MTAIVLFAVLGALLFLLFRIMMLPMKLFWKLLVNSVCGFLILVIWNLFSGLTGIVFALNLITVAVVSLLGLPGFGCLLLLQFL